MTMLSKFIAMVAIPGGLILSAGAAHASTYSPTISGAPIAFTGGFSVSFLGAIALTALVPVANIGLLWWQDWRDRRRRGPIDARSQQHHRSS